jgi:hypothetical protein
MDQEFNIEYDINGNDNFEYAQCLESHSEMFYGLNTEYDVTEDYYGVDLEDGE